MKWMSGLLVVGLLGCTQFPELDAIVESENLGDLEHPPLVPLDGLLSEPVTPVEERAEIEAEMAARVSDLRARADALNAEVVIDDATRERMEEGLRRRLNGV